MLPHVARMYADSDGRASSWADRTGFFFSILRTLRLPGPGRRGLLQQPLPITTLFIALLYKKLGPAKNVLHVVNALTAE